MNVLKLQSLMAEKRLSFHDLFELISIIHVDRIEHESIHAIEYPSSIMSIMNQANFTGRNMNIIVKNFPVIKERIGERLEVSFKLFDYPRGTTLEKAKRLISKDGFIPSDMVFLIFLKILNPHIILNNMIVAPEATWNPLGREKMVAFICGNGEKKEIDLMNYWKVSDEKVTFLGVKY